MAGYPTRTDEPLEGWTRLYVDDPFGNRLELMEPVGAQGRHVGPLIRAAIVTSHPP